MTTDQYTPTAGGGTLRGDGQGRRASEAAQGLPQAVAQEADGISAGGGGGGPDALPVSALSWRVVTGILESGNGNQVGAGTQLCAATAVRLAKWNTHVCNGDFRIFCVAPLNRTFHATSTVLK